MIWLFNSRYEREYATELHSKIKNKLKNLNIKINTEILNLDGKQVKQVQQKKWIRNKIKRTRRIGDILYITMKIT